VRVAVYYNNRDVRLEERPVPKIGPGEMLLRVEASGICGSDVMEWYRIQRAPLVLGHEVAGVVEDAGEGVTRFKDGDRVVATHHVPCNTCRFCLRGHHSVCDTLRSTSFDPGGFAEYLRLPAINVDRGTFHLPDELSFDDGSFVEPLGCVLRGLRLARLRTADSVLVVGSGITGLLNIKAARALGAGRLLATDIHPYRLKTAGRFGAEAIDASEDVPVRVREVLDGEGADLVVVCTGADAAIRQAVGSVGRGGTLLFFAPPEPGNNVSLPMFELWRDEVTVTTSYAASPRDLSNAIELLRSGRIGVNDMITHRLGLDEAGEGFRLTADAGESLKVIIQPQK